jgi:hypothetical protein
MNSTTTRGTPTLGWISLGEEDDLAEVRIANLHHVPAGGRAPPDRFLMVLEVGATEAHLTIVLAALAVSRWIEHRTGWSIRNSSAPPAATAPSRSASPTTPSPPPTLYPTTYATPSRPSMPTRLGTDLIRVGSMAPAHPSVAPAARTSPSACRMGRAGDPLPNG